MYVLKDFKGYLIVSETERRIDVVDTPDKATQYATLEEAKVAAARYSKIVLGICNIVKL